MRKLTLGNSHEIIRDMTEWNTATGVQTAKSGLTLTGFLSTTKTGATIHANVSTSLTERPATGEYYGLISASNITAQLTAILGALPKVTIYERVTGTDYQDYEPIELCAERQAGE